MNKPGNFDEVQASGSFNPVELGGHTCVIKQVSETVSKKNGAPMIVVLFDFDKEDQQAGYFLNDFNNNTRDDKKWPFNGTNWIMVNDFSDKSKTSKKFKTFCVCVEKSNPGFKIQWGGDGWGRQFVGKRIGAVYGNEEDEYNGEYRMRPRLKWFCGVDEAKTAKIPEAKYAKKDEQQAVDPIPGATAVEVDIPF